MRLLMIFIICILFLSYIYGDVTFDNLEDIIQATQAHMDSIKTGRGKFKIQKTTYETEGEKNDLVIGDWLYKEGHWRMKLEAKVWGESIEKRKIDLQKTGRSIATEYFSDIENKGDIDFSYIEKNKNAVVSKKMITDLSISSYGLFFAGISSANYFGTPISEIMKCVQNSTAKVSVKTVPDSSLIRLDIQYFKNNGELESEGVIEISPTQQYSILKYEISTADNNYRICGNVEMELIQTSNIYFPKKASFEILKGVPLKISSKKSFEFTDTELNISLDDQELEITLPPSVIIQDNLTRDIYETKKETNLKQILAGELESVFKKDKLSQEEIEKDKQLAEQDKRKSENAKKLARHQDYSYYYRKLVYKIIIGIIIVITTFYVTFKYMRREGND